MDSSDTSNLVETLINKNPNADQNDISSSINSLDLSQKSYNANYLIQTAMDPIKEETTENNSNETHIYKSKLSGYKLEESEPLYEPIQQNIPKKTLFDSKKQINEEIEVNEQENSKKEFKFKHAVSEEEVQEPVPIKENNPKIQDEVNEPKIMIENGKKEDKSSDNIKIKEEEEKNIDDDKNKENLKKIKDNEEEEIKKNNLETEQNRKNDNKNLEKLQNNSNETHIYKSKLSDYKLEESERLYEPIQQNIPKKTLFDPKKQINEEIVVDEQENSKNTFKSKCSEEKIQETVPIKENKPKIQDEVYEPKILIENGKKEDKSSENIKLKEENNKIESKLMGEEKNIEDIKNKENLKKIKDNEEEEIKKNNLETEQNRKNDNKNLEKLQNNSNETHIYKSKLSDYKLEESERFYEPIKPNITKKTLFDPKKQINEEIVVDEQKNSAQNRKEINKEKEEKNKNIIIQENNDNRSFIRRFYENIRNYIWSFWP